MSYLTLLIAMHFTGHWETLGEPPAEGVEVRVLIETLNQGVPVTRLLEAVDDPQVHWWQWWVKGL